MVKKKKNPEDKVLKDIDALVDWQLTHEPDDYDKEYSEHCPTCRGSWHGLPKDDCPGAFATIAEKKAYRKDRLKPSPLVSRTLSRAERLPDQTAALRAYVGEPTPPIYLAMLSHGTYVLTAACPEAEAVLFTAPWQQVIMGEQPVRRLFDPQETLRRLAVLTEPRGVQVIQPIDEAVPLEIVTVDPCAVRYRIEAITPD